MKNSSKLTWILAAAALSGAPLSHAADAAPAPTTPAVASHPRIDEMRERRMKQLDTALALTPEQRTRINEIWDKAEKEAVGSADAKRLQRRHRREVLKATHADVRAVLTPEQQKKFDALPPERDAATPKSK